MARFIGKVFQDCALKSLTAKRAKGSQWTQRKAWRSLRELGGLCVLLFLWIAARSRGEKALDNQASAFILLIDDPEVLMQKLLS